MCKALVAALVCWLSTALLAQYPPPLPHTPQDHPAQRVLLISIDGLRAVELADWVTAHPQSTLAQLSARGVTYTNAHAPLAGEAPGLLALVTGGTPISTGILSSDVYDRALSPANSNCKDRGAVLFLDGRADAEGAPKLPLDPAHDCQPVPPHGAVRVNNIFELVRSAGGQTAWAGEVRPMVDLLRGPSGKGLDGIFVSKSHDASETLDDSFTEDDRRVAVVLQWIAGKDQNGGQIAEAPRLFGMNFVSLRDGKSSGEEERSLNYVDAALGRMVGVLKLHSLFDSTWIVISATYAQMPGRPRAVSGEALKAIAGVDAEYISTGAVGMVWLKDRGKASVVAGRLLTARRQLGIASIDFGNSLLLTLNSPAEDARMPDILLRPEPGIVWRASNVEMDADAHVALLLSGKHLTGRLDKTWVPTTQTAPLILRALGMEKFGLDALHLEHTPALPGIF